MSWLLFLAMLFMLIKLQRKWKKWAKWWVVGIVAALAAAAFASTNLGGWTAQLIGRILGFPAGWIDVTPAMLAALVVICLIPVIIYGLVHDKSADKPEIIALFLLPLLFIIASGPVAAGGGTLTEALAGFGSQGLGYLIQG